MGESQSSLWAVFTPNYVESHSKYKWPIWVIQSMYVFNTSNKTLKQSYVSSTVIPKLVRASLATGPLFQIYVYIFIIIIVIIIEGLVYL
jgi:hypothetical protein